MLLGLNYDLPCANGALSLPETLFIDLFVVLQAVPPAPDRKFAPVARADFQSSIRAGLRSGFKSGDSLEHRITRGGTVELDQDFPAPIGTLM